MTNGKGQIHGMPRLLRKGRLIKSLIIKVIILPNYVKRGISERVAQLGIYFNGIRVGGVGNE
jgi:hypothetical protein